MRLIRWLQARWHRRGREIDIAILWSAIRLECWNGGMSIADAQEVFMIHANMDPSWSDITEAERRTIVSGLG